MKYRVLLSKDAKKDLYNIFNYIKDILQVPQTDLNQIERLEQKILSLDEMPERYRIYKKIKDNTIRMLTVDKYCVFYVVNKEKESVSIVRILYGARNFSEIL